MDISVIIPLLNEEESLPELESWIRRVMNENKFSYEIIFVDDGSTDGSGQILDDFAEMLADVASVEKPAKLEGRNMLMFLAAKSAK